MATHDITRGGTNAPIALTASASTVPAQIIPHHRLAWDTAMKRFQALKVEYDAHWAQYRAAKRTTPAQDDEADRRCEEYCELQDMLLGMPAPDLTAALWKLEYFTFDDTNDGFTPSWKLSFIQPMVEDFRRLSAAS